MNAFRTTVAWVRARMTQLHDLLSGEDLHDAQQYRSEDLPRWIAPGGTSRSRGRRPGGSRRNRTR